MWADSWTLAAEASQVVGIDPTVAFAAVVGAVVTVIGSVVTLLIAISRQATERVDGVTAKQLADKDLRIQQLEGETLAAEKDRDAWRDKTTKLEIRNATLEAENRRLRRAEP